MCPQAGLMKGWGMAWMDKEETPVEKGLGNPMRRHIGSTEKWWSWFDKTTSYVSSWSLGSLSESSPSGLVTWSGTANPISTVRCLSTMQRDACMCSLTKQKSKQLPGVYSTKRKPYCCSHHKTKQTKPFGYWWTREPEAGTKGKNK